MNDSTTVAIEIILSKKPNNIIKRMIQVLHHYSNCSLVNRYHYKRIIGSKVERAKIFRRNVISNQYKKNLPFISNAQ
jgi:hypothetical protein